MSPINKFGIKFCALLFTIVGFVGTWQMGKNVYQGINGHKWPSIEAQVVVSAVHEMTSYRKKKGVGVEYLPLVEFEYVVNKQTYQDVLEKDGFQQRFVDEAGANEYIKDYPLGAKIKVHYQPSNPKQAVINPGWKNAHWKSVGVGVIMLTLAAGMFYLLFFVKLSDRGAGGEPTT